MTDQVPGIVDPVSSLKAQARVRAKVGLPVLLTALFVLSYRGFPNDFVGPAALIHIFYIVLMLFLAARVLRYSAEQLAFGTAILDPLFLSAWVLMMGPDGGLVIGFYLFTILGFGFRTGPRLMLVCQIASIAGFSTVLVLAPFWMEHEIIWISFLITLVVVPLYAMVLIKKLHEARALAERESQAKSQLLAKVSHELRTPLSGIVAAAQLISAESDDNNRVMNRAETIMGLARDLLREIDDLLDQAKYEARALVLESSLFDLHDQMGRLCMSLEPAAVKKGLAFTVTVDPRIKDRLQGDSRYLSKVLLNLAGNAVKFTNNGKVEIAMTLLEEQGDHCRVRFSVKDTGIGIPRDLHERIYEPFFQADSLTARKYGGTGLGMTIAKEIVNLMGGRIQLESEPGVGSLFYFDLNFARVTTRQTSTNKTTVPTVYGKRILVVDDNATNLSLIRELLLRDRHEVLVAASGTEALELLSQREFDLVFLDFNLGDIDGAKVLQIYRFGKLRTAPVYFLTADATAATAEKLAGAGAVGVLTRPITTEGLRQAIARVCGADTEAGVRLRSGAAQAAPFTAVPSPLPLAAVPAQHLDYSVIEGLGSISERAVFLAEVLSSAVTDIESNCSELMQALVARDSARVRDKAHALKGVCATVGATRLESLANRLMRTTSEELVHAGARLSTDVGETSRQSVAAIRSVLLDRAVNG